VPFRKQVEPEDLNKTKGAKGSLNATIGGRKPVVEIEPRKDYETHNPNPSVSKVLEPIANQWFSLRDFKRVLRSIGLNIFPEPDAEKYVTITNKVLFCYPHLIFLLTSFNLKSMRTNRTRNWNGWSTETWRCVHVCFHLHTASGTTIYTTMTRLSCCINCIK
jgi:hypothetical protein